MQRYTHVDRAREQHDALAQAADGEEMLAATFTHNKRGLTALRDPHLRWGGALVAIKRPAADDPARHRKPQHHTTATIPHTPRPRVDLTATQPTASTTATHTTTRSTQPAAPDSTPTSATNTKRRHKTSHDAAPWSVAMRGDRDQRHVVATAASGSASGRTR